MFSDVDRWLDVGKKFINKIILLFTLFIFNQHCLKSSNSRNHVFDDEIIKSLQFSLPLFKDVWRKIVYQRFLCDYQRTWIWNKLLYTYHHLKDNYYAILFNSYSYYKTWNNQQVIQRAHPKNNHKRA